MSEDIKFVESCFGKFGVVNCLWGLCPYFLECKKVYFKWYLTSKSVRGSLESCVTEYCRLNSIKRGK